VVAIIKSGELEARSANPFIELVCAGRLSPSIEMLRMKIINHVEAAGWDTIIFSHIQKGMKHLPAQMACGSAVSLLP
jgi:hypothetical protein